MTPTPATPPPGTAEHRTAYRSPFIESLRARGGKLTVGRLTLVCAARFGFCWGVDRALALIFSTLATNRHRTIWLLNQIIHNPAVNEDLIKRGVRFVKGPLSHGVGWEDISARDIVVIPAFSAEINDLERLQRIGCEIVDTTCAWVIKPHNRTQRNARDGFTSIIHGYLNHDETRATASLVRSVGGAYLIVADLREAEFVCAAIRGHPGHLARLPANAVSDGFDAERHLARVALLNQTTMLARESREMGQRIREAVRTRWGEAALEDHFRDFDTICRATQENQDAVEALIASSSPDILVVVGGHDSSNTHNLNRVGLLAGIPTYHVQDPTTIRAAAIAHREPATGREIVTRDWLPPGALSIAFTAGASTPDTQLAEAMARVAAAAGVPAPELEKALAAAGGPAILHALAAATDTSAGSVTDPATTSAAE
ncbi:MAG: 4-hydroxy-3-methylbut-2-enyl diphosphate reductase [Planctomycetota bacterium]